MDVRTLPGWCCNGRVSVMTSDSTEMTDHILNGRPFKPKPNRNRRRFIYLSHFITQTFYENRILKKKQRRRRENKIEIGDISVKNILFILGIVRWVSFLFANRAILIWLNMMMNLSGTVNLCAGPSDDVTSLGTNTKYIKMVIFVRGLFF